MTQAGGAARGLPYPDSFYARTSDGAAMRAAAEGQRVTEVAVIGGGLAGLTCARELAAAGRSVTLLEAGGVGHGASGRNGGFVTPGWAGDDATVLRRVGRAGTDALFRLSLEGTDYVRARAETYADPGIALRNGVLRVRRVPGDGSLQRDAEDLRRRFGYEAEYLDTAAVRERCLTRKYFEGLRSDRGFTLHPLNYSRALAREVEQLGGTIHEQSPVEAMARTRDGFTLTTARASIRAEQVIVATGGYTGRLIPRLRAAYVPVATYVMASEVNPDLLATAIRTGDGIGDDRRAGDYYRLVEDGRRLLWGGAITVRDRPPDGVAAYLRRGMIDTYPQLATLKVEIAWSGWMSYARHRMPQVLQLQDGLWACTAFGGHGLNTTAAAALALTRALLGQGDAELRLLSAFGLDWTGGPVGRAAAQATYWWLQWRDRRQEAAHA